MKYFDIISHLKKVFNLSETYVFEGKIGKHYKFILKDLSDDFIDEPAAYVLFKIFQENNKITFTPIYCGLSNSMYFESEENTDYNKVIEKEYENDIGIGIMYGNSQKYREDAFIDIKNFNFPAS